MEQPQQQPKALPQIVDLQPGVQYRGYVVPPGYGPIGPETVQEEDEGPGLVEYWRVLQRRKGTVILISALGLLLAVLITLPMTPVYQAKALVEVQDVNNDFLNMRSVQQFANGQGFNAMMDIQTQIKILQSDSLLERVTEKLKVVKPGQIEQAGDRVSAWRRALNLPEEESQDTHAQALKMAKDNLKVRASGQTRIVEVLVESTDRQLASDYANTLTNEFIEQNMEARWQQTQKTGEWLARQLDEMKVKLERSEETLQAYARRSGLLFTQEKASVSEEKLKQLQSGLSAATAERISKQSRWEMAETASPETLPDVLNDTTLREYSTKLTELRRQLAELKATYTASYPKVQKLEPQLATIDAAYQRERGAILKRIKNEFDEAQRREKLLATDYAKQTSLVRDEGEKGIQYGIFKREVDSNRTLYEAMLAKVKEASIAGAIRASNVRIVDPAKPPKRPSRPVLPLNAALGLLAGVFAGVGFVVTTDRANKTLREPGDAQFYLNLPELGVIPSERAIGEGKASRKVKAAIHNEKLLTDRATGTELAERVELIVHQRKPSMMAESFRAALTSILFAGQNTALGAERPKALVFTSAGPGEGKSTLVSNMATALAEINQRVLLIDADTRKPRQHSIYGVGNERGLTTLLLDGTVRPSEVIAESAVPGVAVLPAGPGVASATNLLYGNAMVKLLEELRGEYDVVLIDTPPMLQIPDARILARMAGGVILVLRAGKTTRDAAKAMRNQLQQDGTKIIGTILNDWNPKASPGGYYGYTGGYYKRYKGYYGGTERNGEKG
jgi:capsular exopolysaccharide synthesis family protein